MLPAMLPSPNVLANPSIHRAVQVLGHGHGAHCSARPHWTSGWPIYCEAFRLGRPVAYGCLLFCAFGGRSVRIRSLPTVALFPEAEAVNEFVLSGLVKRRAQ